MIICVFCGGTGDTFAPTKRTCSVCHGTGKLEGDDGVSAQVAARTWLQGFFHLTVDGSGLVSLWDEEHGDERSYLKLPLTPEQVELIKQTMEKGGATP